MNASYYLAWILSRTIYRLYFRVKVFDSKNVPATGPVILAANHGSFLDPPLVGLGLDRDIHYLARESLFRYPGAGAILRSWNVVPVDRDGDGGSGLKAILNRLLKGEGILLFPEGTRTPDGQLQKARSGVGLVVIKTKAPVIPVRVFGTYDAFGRRHWLPRPKAVAVKYGRPLDLSALRAEAASCDKIRLKQLYRQAADDIMAAIAAMEPKPDNPQALAG